MQSKTERLSSIVARAGGVTPEAYVKGARLVRQMTREELFRQQDVVQLAERSSGDDSLRVNSSDMTRSYPIGIDLEKALQNPNSDYDIVLRNGNIIYIPEYINTVKVSGAVMYPNTVLYQEGENLKYYINRAGGFGNSARKHKVFVINLNGKASKLSLRTH